MTARRYSEERTSYTVQYANNTSTLIETVEYVDDNPSERREYRGSPGLFDTVLANLDSIAPPSRSMETDGTESVCWEGQAAVQAIILLKLVNAVPLEKKVVTKAVATDDSGRQETIIASQRYAWNDHSGGWAYQGEPLY
jgi:hypothetical protein